MRTAFLVALSFLTSIQAQGGAHEYYEVNGAKLYIESAGKGPPVL